MRCSCDFGGVHVRSSCQHKGFSLYYSQDIVIDYLCILFRQICMHFPGGSRSNLARKYIVESATTPLCHFVAVHRLHAGWLIFFF